MNFSLTPELEELINQKVKTGMYTSGSEVVREALRLLKERDDLKQCRLGELRSDIEAGLEDVRLGRTKGFNSASIKAEGQKRRGQKKKTAA